MDYHAHYDILIKRARGRTSGQERHHIIPKCLNGTNNDSNLVYLTYREHYVAHQLLHKMYTESHGLLVAVRMMATRNNRVYSWLKEKYVASMTGKKLGPQSDEHRANTSKALTGVPRPRSKGYTRSPNAAKNAGAASGKARMGIKRGPYSQRESK